MDRASELFERTKTVVRRLDSLLGKAGIDNPQYRVGLCPKQGGGISPSDELTRQATRKIPQEEYDRVLGDLAEIADEVPETQTLDRTFFY